MEKSSHPETTKNFFQNVMNLEKWQSRGCPKADEFLKKYTIQKIDNMCAPEDHDELIEKGERFIDKFDFGVKKV